MITIPGPETREWLLEPNQPHRPSARNGLSGIYDSRRQPGGIGFPSCCRELARLAPNDKDPHDYYAEIGVSRDASAAEIRSAVRKLYLKYHPDTGSHPDAKKLTRIRNIASVLLDPATRERYNRTPDGMRLMDAVYAQELIDEGSLSALNPEEFEAVFEPVPAYGYAATERPKFRPAPRYDFFAVDHSAGDWMLANRWYHHLMVVSGETSYRRVIKVLLTTAAHPSFTEMASIMVIPRHWAPSDTLARLLYHKAGFIPDTPDRAKSLGLSG